MTWRARLRQWNPDWRVLALGLFGCFALTAAFMPPKPQVAQAVVAELKPVALPEPGVAVDAATAPTLPALLKIHPLAALSDVDVGRLVREHPDKLGSFSVGRPSRGLLFNAVQMADDPAWRLVEAAKTWGTSETIETVSAVIRRIALQFPSTPPLWVGNISGRRGGYLTPHKSHQSGRDVDLSYYYVGKQKWYQRATPKNLDVERTWALVREFLDSERVEYIFIDRSVQRLLKDYAVASGADTAWLARVFQGKRGDHTALIRHASGHQTHMHLRLLDDVARESGLRAYPELVRTGKIQKRSYYVSRRDRQTAYSEPQELRTARR